MLGSNDPILPTTKEHPLSKSPMCPQCRSTICSSKNITEVLVFELGHIPHAALVTGGFIRKAVFLVTALVDNEHVHYEVY